MNKETFYNAVRGSLFNGKLTDAQVQGIEALLTACAEYGVTNTDQVAYVLATAYHEVAKTMQPIAEYGKGRNKTYGGKFKYNGKPYNDTNAIFYGRGFTQNTWYENYQKLGKIFGVDLLNSPDLLLTDTDLSAKVSVVSMQKGYYTGKKLSDYFSAGKADAINARKIINRLDKAELIAGYWEKFKAALA